jgi:CubicO group peptidase (beta-lactamase class C family)
MDKLLKRVRYYPVDAVTRRLSDIEVDPATVGMTQASVDRIWKSLVDLYETRLYPALGLCIRRRGKVIIDGTIGHLRGNAPGDSADAPLVQAHPNALFNLFSASKSVTAMLLHLYEERGVINLDRPVSEYIPEFSRHGKGWITLRHILTHRAGIQAVPGGKLDLELIDNWEAIVELFCNMKPEPFASRKLAYHALTGGFVVAEVIRRVTGKNIRQALQEEVLNPLGMSHLNYGVAKEDRQKLAENAFTGPPAIPPISWLLRRALGTSIKGVSEISNSDAFLSGIVPSGNIIGTANEATRFFQCLLNGGELDGVRVFQRDTILRAIADQTNLEFDLTLLLPVRYGTGFMLGGEHYSLYGKGSPRAFGHMGFTNTVLYADPERAISVCLMTSGKPFIHKGLVNWFNIMRTIARCCPRDVSYDEMFIPCE